MKLVYVHGGVLSIRWAWLPCWLALNPKTKHEVARELQDRVLLCGITTADEDVAALERWVRRRFQSLFPFDGLEGYLAALEQVRPREEAPAEDR